jgi:hypothetical protein
VFPDARTTNEVVTIRAISRKLKLERLYSLSTVFILLHPPWREPVGDDALSKRDDTGMFRI